MAQKEREKERTVFVPDPATSTVTIVGQCFAEQYLSQRQGHASFINHGRGSTVTVGPANIGGDARGEEAATCQA